MSSRWVGKRLTTAAGLCERCAWRAERTVRELPADVMVLTSIIGPSLGSLAVRVSGTREPQLNIRPGLEALRDAIDRQAGFWAQALGMEPLDAVRLPERVLRASRWLEPRMGAFVALGPQERAAWTRDGEPVLDGHGYWEVELIDGLGGVLELMKLHRRVRKVAGRTKLVHRLTPACAACNHRALVRDDGGDQVQCEHCGNAFSEDQYDWFVKVTLSAAVAA